MNAPGHVEHRCTSKVPKQDSSGVPLYGTCRAARARRRGGVSNREDESAETDEAWIRWEQLGG